MSCRFAKAPRACFNLLRETVPAATMSGRRTCYWGSRRVPRTGGRRSVWLPRGESYEVVIGQTRQSSTCDPRPSATLGPGRLSVCRIDGPSELMSATFISGRPLTGVGVWATLDKLSPATKTSASASCAQDRKVIGADMCAGSLPFSLLSDGTTAVGPAATHGRKRRDRIPSFALEAPFETGRHHSERPVDFAARPDPFGLERLVVVERDQPWHLTLKRLVYHASSIYV